MRRLTLTLTENEYAELEQRAAQERRTPREMAAHIIANAVQPSVPFTLPGLRPWGSVMDGHGNIRTVCGACTTLNADLRHTCGKSTSTAVN